MKEKKTYRRLKDEVNEYVKIFVKGDELSSLEKVIEFNYWTEKYDKVMLKKKYEVYSNKIKLTDNDCMKIICKRDISIDFSKIRPDNYKTHISDIFRVKLYLMKE